MPTINPTTLLPTASGPASNVALGQVLAKGRDAPSGLYPITTRNDVEHQVGYIGPDTSMWADTGRLAEEQNTGITDGKTLTAPSVASRVFAGQRDIPGPSGRSSRVGKYDWAIEPRSALLAVHRPRGVMAPYVRSSLNDEMIREALDYPIRGNMAYNEWQRTLPHVYEQGNGYALAGPAWVASVGNGDTNVDVF